MRRRIMQWLYRGDVLPSESASSHSYMAASSIPSATLTTVAAVSGASLVAREAIGPGVCKLTMELTKVPVVVTDANAYGGLQILDFAQGRIAFLGVTASIQWAVATARASTINDSASLTWGVGTAIASNATLATTMIDAIPKTTKVLSAATTDFNTASNAALAATSSHFDGTSTAKDLFLNAAFETATDIDGDGTLWASGTITAIYCHFGDY